MLEYKGYSGGRIEVDDEGYFHGRVLGLRDVITFVGKTAEDLEKAFRDSLDEYLEFCEEQGETPDKPYAGKFQVRVPPELHRKIVAVSEAHDMSMNAWVTQALEKEAERDLP